MNDIDLHSKIINNFNAFFSKLSYQVVEIAGASCTLSKIDTAYFNIVLPSPLHQQISQTDIENVIKTYQTNNKKNFIWWHSSGYATNNLAVLLQKNGFKADPIFVGMITPIVPNNASYNIKGGFDVKAVSNLAELEAWIKPFSLCFGFDQEQAENVKQAYQSLFNSKQLQHFIVYDSDKPIAGASVFMKDGVAGLYNLCVLPQYRQQGIGSFLQVIRLNYAKQRSCNYAITQAAESSKNISAQHGFKDIVALTPYVYICD